MNWLDVAAVTLPLWLAVLLIGGAIVGSMLPATTRRDIERLILFPAMLVVCLALIVLSIPAQDWRIAGVAFAAAVVVATAWRRRARKPDQLE